MNSCARALAAFILIGLSPTVVRAICTPRVQWSWEGDVRSPDFPMACTTPVVVQLSDDNRDGRIDSADVPDVAFLHNDGLSGQLTALDGASGGWRFDVGSPELWLTGLAAGDIDGDGIVELVAVHRDQDRLVAFEHTGAWKWTSDVLPSPIVFANSKSPGIADLDQDGVPEIFIGDAVFRADGGLLWQGTEGDGDGVGHAVDLIPTSPGLELLAFHTAYAADGGILWTSGALNDGFTGVADFDGDGDPEIVLHQNLPSAVYLLDHLGNPLGPPYRFTTVGLTHPTIADLDGDRIPEVIVAGGPELQALRWTGTEFRMLWSQPMSDPVGAAGITTYDLEGDGGVDVVCHDQEQWYILDGATGAVRSAIPFGSATSDELAVIADIDNDCVTEIVVTACAREWVPGSVNRVTAYECDSAPPARTIWNQYGYHVTNVDYDGTIPRREEPPWRSHNTWLAQVSDDRGPRADAGADLSVCEGETAPLDGSGSIPCDASGLEYRWLDGPAEVCPWSASPTCAVAPIATTTYTLEVRCPPSAHACVATDDVTVVVFVEPDVVPRDIGNTLRAIRVALDVAMSWATAPTARSYSLYRGTVKGVWPPPLSTGLPAPTWVLPDVTPPPPLYFYRVAGASCSGQEGP